MEKEEIFTQMERFCAYQDRCEAEVRQKLSKWPLSKVDQDGIVDQLKKENFLDEERFAKSFARGKFQLKNWGLNKIKLELRKRRIPDNCIQKALLEINKEAYQSTLARLLEKEWLLNKDKLKGRDLKHKLYQFGLRKGYQPDEIWPAMETLDFNADENL